MARNIGYRSYMFRDHDPVLDALDTLFTQADVGPKKLEELSGIRQETFRRWKRRQTKRPQYTTVAASVRAAGGRISITYRGKNINGSGK